MWFCACSCQQRAWLVPTHYSPPLTLSFLSLCADVSICGESGRSDCLQSPLIPHTTLLEQISC